MWCGFIAHVIKSKGPWFNGRTVLSHGTSGGSIPLGSKAKTKGCVSAALFFILSKLSKPYTHSLMPLRMSAWERLLGSIEMSILLTM